MDSFQAINEELGHAAGDALLKRYAELMDNAMPGQVYRVGGDELAVVFAGSTLEQAFLRVEAIRTSAAFSDLGAQLSGRSITLSIGVAHCPRDVKEIGGLYKAADAALLAAKEGGRNRVALAPNEDMVMKSSYYPAGSLRRLKLLAEKRGRTEAKLLREALDDLLRKYDIR